MQSAPYLATAGANSSPWTKRTARFREGLIRYEGEQLFPSDMGAPKDVAALLLIAMNVAPEHEAEFDEWYNTEHIPALGGVNGTLSARRYRGTGTTQRYVALYHLASSEVPYSTEWKASEHPVDRTHAAALSRPSALRMPTLHAGRLDQLEGFLA